MGSQDLFVLDDLKKKFSQFDQIAAIAANLQHLLGQINTQNAEVGGHHDAIAQAYHQQIDQPTDDLVTLVSSIQQLFALTGDNGGAAADDFGRADDDASSAAQNW
jgi:hypothetical protein